MEVNVIKLKKSAAVFMVVMMLFNVIYTFSAFAEVVSSQAQVHLKVNDVEFDISDEVNNKINVKSEDMLEIKLEYLDTYFKVDDRLEVVLPDCLKDIKFKYSSEDISSGVVGEDIEGVELEDNLYKLIFNEEILEKAQGSIVISAAVDEIEDGVVNEIKMNVIDGEFIIELEPEIQENPVVEEEKQEVIPQEEVVNETVEKEVAVEQIEDITIATETQIVEFDPSKIEGIAYGVLDNSKVIESPYVAKNGFDIGGVTSIAFDFHIFSNSSILNAHTQGNIATKTLESDSSNFGSKTSESNYFEESANGIKAIESNGYTVLGDNISTSIEDNGNKVVIGNGGIALEQEQSQLIYKQINEREKYIDIETEFLNLKSISNALSTKEGSKGVTLSEVNGENQSITVEASNGKVNYYLNVKASDISDGNSKRVLNISVPSGITLIINVDMSGVNQDYLSNIVINLNSATNGEGNVGTENNVLWNLRNGDGAFTSDGYAKVGCSDYFMGTILAPEADIQYGALNGSVIANKTMQNGQESHKWDFTGHNGDDEEELEVVLQPVKVSIEAKKNLEGRDLIAGLFKFELLNEEGEKIQDAVNDELGFVNFQELEYSKVGEYIYKVKEVKGEEVGITYDTSEYQVTVKVTEDEDNKLVATVVYPEDGVVFTNKYEKPVVDIKPTKISLEATKKIEGKELAEDVFNFIVLEGETQVATGTNNNEGKIVFSEIPYSEEGTHEYTVKEVKGDLEGVTYDVAEYKVTVNVIAGEDGQLVANVAYPEGGVVFTNKYEEAKAVVTLEATKKLTGKTLEDGMFSFEVVDEDGAIVSTGKNTADGKINFTQLSFDKAGSYSYKVREVNNGLKGIIYDTTEFNVTINIKESGKGKLDAEVIYVENGIVFNNKYETNVTAVILEATKKLTGKDLESDMFMFEVIDENNKIVSSGKNDKSGKIMFNLINYNTAGSYKYTIREVKGTLEGITYDNTTYKVTVTVTDDGNGKLSATVAYPKSGVIFNNTYNGSVTVNHENPKTGDKSMAILVVIIVVAGVGLAVLQRKRNKK